MNIKKLLGCCFFVSTFLVASIAQAQVGISETSITPVASSILELNSTSKGFLTPRMTSAQRTGISSPAEGLVVYQTDGTKGFYYYNGSSWILLGTQLTFSTGLTNTSGTVTVNSSQNISQLSNLTSNGIVTTSGGNGTLTVMTTPLSISNGGTGVTSLTAYMPVAGGTTSTGALQSVAAGSASGQALTYQGASSLPTFSALNLSGTSVVTGTLPITNGGTGASTKAAAFNNLSPMTTEGDIIYGGASGTGTRLSAGTNGQILTLASGVPSWVDATGGTGSLVAVRQITSGVTYTPTSGTTKILIQMVGGGGGGGGADVLYGVGAGGGAGGFAQKYITGISSLTSYTIAIGSGGSGGAAGSVGSAGTATTFQTNATAVPASTTFTANGGAGGTGDVNNSKKVARIGGAGGTSVSNTASKADVFYSGNAGGYSISRDNTEYNISGFGASTLFGSGGASLIACHACGSSAADNTTTDVAGNAATGKGAGGGGAYAGTSTGASGGSGSGGMIIIFEYK